MNSVGTAVSKKLGVITSADQVNNTVSVPLSFDVYTGLVTSAAFSPDGPARAHLTASLKTPRGSGRPIPAALKGTGLRSP
jgi:hypothetical protein